MAATECVPFAKTGGMADAVYSLSRELARLGAKVTFFMPYYRNMAGHAPVKKLAQKSLVRTGSSVKEVSYYSSTLPGTEVPMVLVRYDNYFFREELYGEGGMDYADNLNRFVLLARAILNYILLTGMPADVIHCNDWHTALLSAYLKLLYKDEMLKKTRTLLTIHNLSYQGIFPMNDYVKLNLSWEYFTHDRFEYFGKLNVLKAGLVFSDGINTVSPTYRNELMTSDESSRGLTGNLYSKKEMFFGILNGADYGFWHPGDYDADSPEKKRGHKEEFLKKAGLQNAEKPLLVMVSRIVAMKGFDILIQALPAILKNKLNLVILGRGDPALEKIMLKIEKQNKNFKLYLEFNEKLAKQLLAAGDILLMPSRTEPCGLSQMYAMKFGTVPLVRHTGGLADTVKDYDRDRGRATGFSFYHYHPQALLQSVGRALVLFENSAEWQRIQKNGMRQDFSWRKSAEDYMRLYGKICR